MFLIFGGSGIFISDQLFFRMFKGLPIYLKFFVALTLLAIVLIIIVYVAMFAGGKLSDDAAHWGQVGDYFGGMLNPLLGILTLLVTIQIAREVNKINLEQTERQLNTQKRMLKSQLQYEILRDFRVDVLDAQRKLNAVFDVDFLGDYQEQIAYDIYRVREVVGDFAHHYGSVFTGVDVNPVLESCEKLSQVYDIVQGWDTARDLVKDLKKKIDTLLKSLNSSVLQE